MTQQASSGKKLAAAHAGRFRIVPYAELRAKATELAAMLLERYSAEPEGIVVAPILGGGGLPTRLIVDALIAHGVVRSVVPCTIRSYTGVGQLGEVEILLPLDAQRVRGQIVVGVDDMVDHGGTLAAFRAHAEASGAREVDSAVVYAKPSSSEEPGHVAEGGVTQWLVMPGEELDFMSELVAADAELAGLSPLEQQLYFEGLGMPADTVTSWQAISQLSAPRV